MTSKVQNRLVEKFLSEVEDFLQDLGPDLREDILREVRENLEARAEDENGELSLPNSLDYANDLRQAAGLQPVAPEKRVFKDFVAGIQERLDASSVVKAVRNFLSPFKPLFWMAIGISTFGFIQLYLLGDTLYFGVPSNLEEVLLWIAIILGSVWVGSANFGPLLRRIRAIAVLATFIPMVIMFQGITYGVVTTIDELVNGNPALRTTGLIYNGQRVTNIFPYDAEGNLLENVRLVDDMGRPLNSSAETLLTPVVMTSKDGQISEGFLAPRLEASGEFIWNVYPLKGAPSPGQEGYLEVKTPK